MRKRIINKTNLELLLVTAFVMVVNIGGCVPAKKEPEKEPDSTATPNVKDLQEKLSKLKEDREKEGYSIVNELKKVGHINGISLNFETIPINSGGSDARMGQCIITDTIKDMFKMDKSGPAGGTSELNGFMSLIKGRSDEANSSIADFISANLLDKYNLDNAYKTGDLAMETLAKIFGTVSFTTKHQAEVYLKIVDFDLTKNKEALKYVESLSDDFEVTKYKGNYGPTPKWEANGTVKISMKEYKQKAKPTIEAIIKHREKMISIDADMKKLEEGIEKSKKDEKK